MPEPKVTTGSTIFIDVFVVIVVGEQETLLALNDFPEIGFIGEDGNVTDLGESLGDVGAVIDNDTVIRIPLKGPLVFIARHVFLRGNGIAFIALGRIHIVSAFAQGEVIPVCIVEVGRQLERQCPRGRDMDDIVLTFGQFNRFLDGVGRIGLACYAVGDFTDDVAFLTYLGEFIEDVAVSIHDAIDDMKLVAIELVQSSQRFRRVEITLLDESRLITAIGGAVPRVHDDTGIGATG